MKKLFQKTALMLFVVFIGSMTFDPALAASRHLVLEGDLHNLDGTPVQGAVSVTVSLFAGQMSTTPQWMEIHQGVMVQAGRFNLVVGSHIALDPLLFDLFPDLWMGMAVGQDPELTRIPIGASGYSLAAQHSQTCDTLLTAAGDLECSGCVAAHELSFYTAAAASAGGGALSLDCIGCLESKHIAAGQLSLDRLSAAGCAPGDVIKRSTLDGSWVCGVDKDSGGDVTEVVAGPGLLGGGTQGAVTLQVDPTVVQRRLVGQCPNGQYLRAIDIDGQITCAPDRDTTVLAGTGLEATSTSGSTHLQVDSAVFQRRLQTSCAAGSAIRAVDQNGGVTCVPDQDTKYLPGLGMTLSGTTFAVQKSQITGWASEVCYDTPAEIEANLPSNLLRTGTPSSITSAMIVDGTITTNDIAANANIPFSKLTGVAPANHSHSLASIPAGTFATGSYVFNTGTTVSIEGKLTQGGCPAFFSPAGANLCYGQWRNPRTYAEAQRSCILDAAHVCTYDETYIIWSTFGHSQGMADGDWIGNVTADNKRLCVNKDNDVTDFEGECDKRDVRRFRCCLGQGR
jgi:hypothetical protein